MSEAPHFRLVRYTYTRCRDWTGARCDYNLTCALYGTVGQSMQIKWINCALEFITMVLATQRSIDQIAGIYATTHKYQNHPPAIYSLDQAIIPSPTQCSATKPSPSCRPQPTHTPPSTPNSTLATRPSRSKSAAPWATTRPQSSHPSTTCHQTSGLLPPDTRQSRAHPPPSAASSRAAWPPAATRGPGAGSRSPRRPATRDTPTDTGARSWGPRR